MTNLNKSHNGKNSASKKSKKASKNNNPYPESGRPDYRPSDSSQSAVDNYATPPSRRAQSRDSYSSMPESRHSAGQDNHIYNSSRSAAPTVATQPETIHSDAGYSRALTGTTAGGPLSSIDGATANSTFSSPNQSTHSLTTTLTTIQSTNALTPTTINNTNNNSHNLSHPHSNPNSPSASAVGQNPVQFTHQYPITASAIPSHLQPAPAQQQHQPTTYASATAHNLLTDNASILTLASSSKRRRRSMDTDASVRAMAPRSVWGDSRESLPLSVLSGNIVEQQQNQQAPTSSGIPTAIRPSPTGGHLRDERASVYSNQGVSAPALASERNSYYASSQRAPTFKDGGADGRSVRSIQVQAPTSTPSAAAADSKSVNFDGKSVNFDGASLRGYEGSVRSGALGHGRNESVSGSPLNSPSLLRRPSGALSLNVGDAGEVGSLKEDGLGEVREGSLS